MVHEVKLTDKEKMEMYMKFPKNEIKNMLIESNRLINAGGGLTELKIGACEGCGKGFKIKMNPNGVAISNKTYGEQIAIFDGLEKKDLIIKLIKSNKLIGYQTFNYCVKGACPECGKLFVIEFDPKGVVEIKNQPTG
jgi:hypothetical protein